MLGVYQGDLSNFRIPGIPTISFQKKLYSQNRRGEGKEQPDADKNTRGKILNKQRILKENIAPTVRTGHINPRGTLTSGKILSL